MAAFFIGFGAAGRDVYVCCMCIHFLGEMLSQMSNAMGAALSICGRIYVGLCGLLVAPYVVTYRCL